MTKQERTKIKRKRRALARGSRTSKPVSKPLEIKSVCGLCKSDLREGYVLWCAECKTPHHYDCWKLMEICTIYGCRGSEGKCSKTAHTRQRLFTINFPRWGAPLWWRRTDPVLLAIFCLAGSAILVLLVILIVTVIKAV